MEPHIITTNSISAPRGGRGLRPSGIGAGDPCVIVRFVGGFVRCRHVRALVWPRPKWAQREVDVGVVTFATVSDGTAVQNPRWAHQVAARMESFN